MPKTLNEKYNYNLSQDTAFARAYCEAVDMYLSFGHKTYAEQKFIKKSIDFEKHNALKGDVRSKGFMCGIRDASRERKTKKK